VPYARFRNKSRDIGAARPSMLPIEGPSAWVGADMPRSCRRGDLREPRRAPGSSFSLQSTTEDALMPTLTTREHGEIHVHYHQVTRMADRLWRFGSPARRTAYVEKARQRLAAGPARHSDAAIVLAAGAGLPPMLPDDLVTGTGKFSAAALTPPSSPRESPVARCGASPDIDGPARVIGVVDCRWRRR